MTRPALSFSLSFLAFALLCKADIPPGSAKSIRRWIYALPEALPKGYKWDFRSGEDAAAIWVGFRFDQKGGLSRTPPEKMPAAIAKTHDQESHLLLGLKDSAAGIAILNNPEIQNRAIISVNELLRELPGVGAVQIDFEYLPPENAGKFVSFIRRLKKEIMTGTRVYTAVFPPVGMPEKWRAFHNLPELAHAADGIVVMLYDYHRQGTEPGCVSGIGWLDENAAALAKLPREKIWLGAPLYGYRFEGKKATAIRRRSFENIKSPERQADGCRSKPSSQGVAYYPAEALYAHYEKLVQKYGFAGLAYWRAGLEQ